MFEAFPSVVKAELDRIGQNQQWLAEKLDISHVSVSNWLKGKRRPSAESVEAVARAFGRNASWLFEQMEQVTPSVVPVDPAVPVPVDPKAAWDSAWDAAQEIPVPAAKVALHPFTSEDTRDVDMNRVLGVDETCPRCGRHGEAA